MLHVDSICRGALQACLEGGRDGQHGAATSLGLCSPGDTVFIVFSSGSTGTPKGVITTHCGFCTAAAHLEPALCLTQESRVYDFAPYSFDVAVHNVLLMLMSGGCICVPPAECLICMVHHVAAHEGAVAAATIGRPVGCAAWILKIHGGQDDLVAFGHVGELAIEGPIASLDYVGGVKVKAWRRDAGFLVRGAEPQHAGRRGLLYTTGDLARYNADGSIIYVGRLTKQIKVHGQRVELGEVESQIRQSGAVGGLRHVVVVELVDVGGHGGSTKPRLCAFVQLDKDSDDDDEDSDDDDEDSDDDDDDSDDDEDKDEKRARRLLPEEDPLFTPTTPPQQLLTWLQHHLPTYMIASLFVHVSHICPTQNGKVVDVWPVNGLGAQGPTAAPPLTTLGPGAAPSTPAGSPALPAPTTGRRGQCRLGPGAGSPRPRQRPSSGPAPQPRRPARYPHEGLDWPPDAMYTSAVHFGNMNYLPQLRLGSDLVPLGWSQVVVTPLWTTVLALQRA
ncbi:hypothetical protein CDD81_57 [Ophiocordyceps australis]|uniref:AMP-dependent synthetase/ligase domain-containing protein n=1 Tax=Ophiocordyceps australis TaxID=1399860 RepID=A0A2C5YIJ2_9HYPO|nr:hypothetical protein CDD81_57 [Ophiocordyceps australis]